MLCFAFRGMVWSSSRGCHVHSQLYTEFLGYMRSHLKTTNNRSTIKIYKGPLCTKKPKQKHTKKQRESKPKLIVDEKGVILLFLEPPSPNKNQNKNPQSFCGWLLWEVEYTIYKQTHPYHKNINHYKRYKEGQVW